MSIALPPASTSHTAATLDVHAAHTTTFLTLPQAAFAAPAATRPKSPSDDIPDDGDLTSDDESDVFVPPPPAGPPPPSPLAAAIQPTPKSHNTKPHTSTPTIPAKHGRAVKTSVDVYMRTDHQVDIATDTAVHALLAKAGIPCAPSDHFKLVQAGTIRATSLSVAVEAWACGDGDSDTLDLVRKLVDACNWMNVKMNNAEFKKLRAGLVDPTKPAVFCPNTAHLLANLRVGGSVYKGKDVTTSKGAFVFHDTSDGAGFVFDTDQVTPMAMHKLWALCCKKYEHNIGDPKVKDGKKKLPTAMTTRIANGTFQFESSAVALSKAHLDPDDCVLPGRYNATMGLTTTNKKRSKSNKRSEAGAGAGVGATSAPASKPKTKRVRHNTKDKIVIKDFHYPTSKMSDASFESLVVRLLMSANSNIRTIPACSNVTSGALTRDEFLLHLLASMDVADAAEPRFTVVFPDARGDTEAVLVKQFAPVTLSQLHTATIVDLVPRPAVVTAATPPPLAPLNIPDVPPSAVIEGTPVASPSSPRDTAVVHGIPFATVVQPVAVTTPLTPGTALTTTPPPTTPRDCATTPFDTVASPVDTVGKPSVADLSDPTAAMKHFGIDTPAKRTKFAEAFKAVTTVERRSEALVSYAAFLDHLTGTDVETVAQTLFGAMFPALPALDTPLQKAIVGDTTPGASILQNVATSLLQPFDTAVDTALEVATKTLTRAQAFTLPFSKFVTFRVVFPSGFPSEFRPTVLHIVQSKTFRLRNCTKPLRVSPVVADIIVDLSV